MNRGSILRQMANTVLREEYTGVISEVYDSMKERAMSGGYNYKFSPKEPIRKSILPLLKHEFPDIEIIESYYSSGNDKCYEYWFDWKGAK